MRYAFFDFDGTLIKHDSFIGFAKFAVERPAFYLALLKSLPTIAAWKTGLKTNSYAKECLFGHLFRGMEYDRFRKLGIRYAEEIDKDLRPDIFDILKRHQNEGCQTIIVSASIAEWITPWAQRNGVSVILSTEPEVDSENRLTGKFKSTNCHGGEKARRILEMIPDIAEHESWAYGDSHGDDAMLALVNHPQKV